MSDTRRESMLPDAKRQDDRSINPYIHYILRPISFRPAVLLRNLGVSANGCTLISAIVLFAGVALTAYAPHANIPELSLTYGAVLVNLYLFLDVLDGNIARLNGTSSNAGAFYDETLNSIAGVAVPLSVGIALYYQPGGLAFYIVAGCGIGICRLMRRVMTNQVSSLVGSGEDRRNLLGSAVRGPKYWASVVNSVMLPTLIVATALNGLVIWLLFYFLFNLAVLAYTFRWAYGRLHD